MIAQRRCRGALEAKSMTEDQIKEYLSSMVAIRIDPRRAGLPGG